MFLFNQLQNSNIIITKFILISITCYSLVIEVLYASKYICHSSSLVSTIHKLESLCTNSEFIKPLEDK